jgi:hypothetical protein
VSTRTKAILVTLAVAVPAFLLTPVLFPPPPGPAPSAGQLPFFLALSVLDSLLLGAGVAFLIFGWPVVSRLTRGNRARALAIYLPVGYLMVSWWLHINLHQSTPFTFENVMAIDYAFHVPLFVVPFVLIWGLAGVVRDATGSTSTAAATR